MSRLWVRYLIGFFVIVGIEIAIAGNYLASILRQEPADSGTQTQILPDDGLEEEGEEALVLTIPKAEEIPVVRTNREYHRCIVKPGDTLWTLSTQYRGSGKDYMFLAECNGIQNADLIYAGQILFIPVDVPETVMQKDDWFYRNEIPIQSAGIFSLPLTVRDGRTGKKVNLSCVPVTASFRTIDMDFKKKGYQMIEAVFEVDMEYIPASADELYYYFEAADRYTGVSFAQHSTLLMEAGGTQVYELAIRNPELGYEGVVNILHYSDNNRVIMQAEIPKEYDGLVFGFGEPDGTDMEDYDADQLYKADHFYTEDVERYYFAG